MANYDLELKEYEQKLRVQIKGINKILGLNTNGLLDNAIEGKLDELREKATKLLNKLEKNEFEISIVGLEKTGKSSFVNAMIGNDILPSKPGRCTYTSTSIRYGNDTAIVKFFTKEEFESKFQSALKQLGIKNYEMYTYEALTLENYKKLFDEVNMSESEKLESGTTGNKDIEEILNNKENIKKFIGSAPKEFRGTNELEDDYFKSFITEPAYALAVKEIIIYSDKLDKMQNVIIYDVPGFDSPTQIHKEQTSKKMRDADAIIYIARANQPSLNQPELKMFAKESDEDGVRIGDKIFVFANKADYTKSKEELQANINEIKTELLDKAIINEKLVDSRVIAGSALAKLEADGKVDGTETIDKLNGYGIDDGIDCIKRKLEEYNKTERFEVLKSKINRLQNDIRKVFDGEFEEGIYSGFDSSLGISDLVTKKLDDSRDKIIKAIEEYHNNFKREYSPEKQVLTSKMKKDVIEKLTVEEYGIKDDEFRIACNHNDSIYDVHAAKDVDMYLRKAKYPLIYNAFSSGIVQLAIQEHENCDENIEKIFEEALGITENNPYYSELKSIINEFIHCQKGIDSNSGYYKSLIERFSVDLFEILIQYSFGDMSRWDRFEAARANFYSLAMYSDNFDDQLPPGKQGVLYTILFHSKKQKANSKNTKKAIEIIENVAGIAVSPEMAALIRVISSVEGEKVIEIVQKIVERIDLNNDKETKGGILSGNFEEIVNKYMDAGKNISEMELTKESYEQYFNGKRDRSIDDVREEIDEDIRILQELLDETVVNAICIETPFLALETQTVNNIKVKVSGEEYRKLVANNIHKICVDEYSNLKDGDQKQMAYKAMMEEIKNILDSIKNVDINM